MATEHSKNVLILPFDQETVSDLPVSFAELYDRGIDRAITVAIAAGELGVGLWFRFEGRPLTLPVTPEAERRYTFDLSLPSRIHEISRFRMTPVNIASHGSSPYLAPWRVESAERLNQSVVHNAPTIHYAHGYSASEDKAAAEAAYVETYGRLPAHDGQLVRHSVVSPVDLVIYTGALPGEDISDLIPWHSAEAPVVHFPQSWYEIDPENVIQAMAHVHSNV
jgi:hypothetical protein